MNTLSFDTDILTDLPFWSVALIDQKSTGGLQSGNRYSSIAFFGFANVNTSISLPLTRRTVTDMVLLSMMKNLKCDVTKVLKSLTPQAFFVRKDLRCDHQFLAGFFQNILHFFSKIFADSKIIRIFALELKQGSLDSNAKMGGRFVSAHFNDSNILLNRSGNRPKAFIETAKLKGSTVFSFFNHFLSEYMAVSVKDASGVQGTTASRLAHETRPKTTTDTYHIVSDTHPLLSLTKKQLVSVIERRSTEAQAKTNYFDLAFQHFQFWMNCERSGEYAYDVRDKRLVEGLQALRTSFGVGKTLKF